MTEKVDSFIGISNVI